MSRTRIAAVVVCVLLACWIPVAAWASGGWGWPVCGDVLQGYGVTYQGQDGGACTHGGLDIAGEPGESVRACAAGDVVFAGKVPAGEGAQAFAVTVLTADGLRVTYLPMRSTCISKGSHVRAGESLGALASDGDASSASTHLHLGVRRGEARLDPAAFLGERTSSEAHGPSSASAPSPAPAAKHAPSGSPSQAAVTAAGAAGAPAPLFAPHGGESAPAHAASSADAVRESLRAATSTLTRVPTLRRVAPIAERTVLNTEQMWADATSGRGWLSKGLLCLGLALVAGICVLGVVRGMRTVDVERIGAVALARRSVH